MNKAAFALIAVVIFSGFANSFNPKIVDQQGNQTDLVFDIANTPEKQSFFQNIDQIDYTDTEVTAFSFTDNGIKNPDASLEVCDSSIVGGDKIQLYQTSTSGNITIPILVEDVSVPDFNGNCTTVDMDVSSFKALFPGRPSAGIVNQTLEPVYENQTVNGTEQEVRIGEELVRGKPINLSRTQGILDGNYSIGVEILSVKGETKLTVNKVTNGDGEQISYPVSPSQELMAMSLLDSSGEVLDERKTKLKSPQAFDYRFEGGEKVEINNILSLKTKTVNGCQTLNETDSYYILNKSLFNQESSCIQVNDTENSVVDFANKTVSGNNNESKVDGRCGITVSNSSSIAIQNPRVQNWDAGICVRDSEDVSIGGLSSAQGNTDGIEGQNSSFNVSQIKLNNEDSDITGFNNTEINMNQVNFASGNVSGKLFDAKAKNVEEEPPRPENLTEEKESMGQFVNLTLNDENGYVEDIGFTYPPLSESNLNPTDMFKYDRINTSVQGNNNLSSVEWYIEELDTVRKSNERFIFHDRRRSNLSIFGLFGERVEGEGPGQDEGEGSNESDEGTNSPGGSGGPGSGTRPTPEPEPTPVELDLDLNQENYSVEQGETFGVNFSLENTGEVDVENAFVEADVRTGWSSGRKDFEEIDEGDTAEGQILLSVYDDEIPGSYEVDFKAKLSGGTVQDIENAVVDVNIREEVHSLRIIEAPTFLTLSKGMNEEVALLVENNGDYDYESVSLSFRNVNDCIEGASGTHQMDRGVRKSIEFEVSVKDSIQTCQGVMLLESGNGQELGIQPVQIQVEEPDLLERLSTSLLPIIVFIWSLITIVMGVKEYRRRAISR